MKIRFKKNYLDFKIGKDYDVIDATAIYLIRLKVAKEVIEKNGNPSIKRRHRY